MRKNIDILIVEDSPTQAMRLKIILEQRGYRVVTAHNGIEGLNLIRKNFFPIVITDWIMPEMDGFKFCQAIREQEFPGYVYIILLTTKASRNDIIAGLDAGADDYLVKPPDEAELIARLKAANRIVELEHSLRKLIRENEILSITDPLTKTYNRRYLNTHLPDSIKHAMKYGHPLSVIICDIDHFKNINDNYGHQAGDRVLEEFARCIMEFIREGTDWMVRYGGEEFFIVLPETNMDGANKVAERYRLMVSQTPISTGTDIVRITASFGVASIIPSEKNRQITMESLIDAADQCMYRAKEDGRNRSFGVLLG